MSFCVPGLQNCCLSWKSGWGKVYEVFAKIFCYQSFKLVKIFLVVILRLFLISLKIFLAIWNDTLCFLSHSLRLWIFLNFLVMLCFWNWYLKLLWFVFVTFPLIVTIFNLRSSLSSLILTLVTDFFILLLK